MIRNFYVCINTHVDICFTISCYLFQETKYTWKYRFIQKETSGAKRSDVLELTEISQMRLFTSNPPASICTWAAAMKAINEPKNLCLSSAHTLTFPLSFFSSFWNSSPPQQRHGASCFSFCGACFWCFSGCDGGCSDACFFLQESRTCTRERSASVRSCWVSRGRPWWWCVTCSPSSTSECPLTQKQALTVNDHRPFLSIFPVLFPSRGSKAEDKPLLWWRGLEVHT